jgi:hypothetical protein
MNPFGSQQMSAAKKTNAAQFHDPRHRSISQINSIRKRSLQGLST